MRGSLASATPIGDENVTTRAVNEALRQMWDETSMTPVRFGESRHRRRAARAAIVAAVVIGGATGVAAAETVWSEWFDSPDSTETLRDEPYLSTSSAEFSLAFADAVSDYPLPEGENYDALGDRLSGSGALKQVVGLRGEMALHSTCLWIDAWLSADRREDFAAQTAATQALSDRGQP